MASPISHFLAIFNVSENVISGILPFELEPLTSLKKQIEETLLHHQEDTTNLPSNLPLILKKIKTRESQITSQSAYEAQCKRICEIIERQEDGDWEIFNIQLNHDPDELKSLKRKTLDEITDVQNERRTAEKLLSKWRHTTKRENVEAGRSFEDALIDPEVTEPLLCSANLNLILEEDSSNTKFTLADKFMQGLMSKEMRTAVQNQRQLKEQKTQILLQILEPIKTLLNPSPDAKMLGTLKEHIATKTKLALAIDNRLLKLTFLPETTTNSERGVLKEVESLDEDATAGTEDPENCWN